MTVENKDKVETVDIKVIETKLDKKEPLTKAEEDFLLKSEPAPAEFGGNPAPGTEAPEDGEDGNKETPASETPEEKAAKDKADADKKAKEAADLKAVEDKKTIEANEKDPLFKIEQMLQENQDRPDEQVDVAKADFSPREKAYFWQMRRDRKAKQQAEADRDAAKFELSKTKKEKPAEKPAEEEDPFKDREDDDIFTVADAKKILAKSQKKEEVKMDASFMELPAVQTFLKSCDIVAANEHKEDYEVVMDLTDQIIMTNPAHQKLIAEAFSRGENPALKQYELIKGDPSFSKLLPVAQTRVAARKTKKAEEKPKEEPKAKSAEELQKEADAKKAEEALEANQTKPKTSGHAEGKDKIEGSDLTIEQIASMSDREFAKLPKKTREKYLEMYG